MTANMSLLSTAGGNTATATATPTAAVRSPHPPSPSPPPCYYSHENRHDRRGDGPAAPGGEAAISVHDVLLGRGGQTNNHAGNREYRRIVYEHQNEYLHARKKEKALIARRIVKIVQSQGGRFLKKDDARDAWIEVPHAKAVSKTSQALREGLDVRNMTVRPSKIFRCTLDEAKGPGSGRPRVASGKVVAAPQQQQHHHHHHHHHHPHQSPYSSFSVVSVDNLDAHSLPDLHDEGVVGGAAALAIPHPVLNYRPDLSQSALDDFCEV